MTTNFEGLRALTTDELDLIAGGAIARDTSLPFPKGPRGPTCPPWPPIGPGGTGPTYPIPPTGPVFIPL